MNTIEFIVDDENVSFHVFLDAQKFFMLTFNIDAETMEKLCSEWLEMKLFKKGEEQE